MNVSIENRIIWLAPERTATTITKKVFENYNFFSQTRKNNYKLVELKKTSQSHDTMVDNQYKNFKIVVNIRNPYDRIYACFLKYHLQRPFTKKTVDAKEKFNDWVQKTFLNHGYNVFLSPFYNQDEDNFLNKWTFEGLEPDFIVKMENLHEDIMKLPFIKKEEDSYVKNLIENNTFINKRHFLFNDLYDTRSAKLIYHFYKPIFYKFDYSPFSFTKKELTNSEKISFIHGNID